MLYCYSRQMYTVVLGPAVKVERTDCSRLHFLSDPASGYMKNMTLEN